MAVVVATGIRQSLATAGHQMVQRRDTLPSSFFEVKCQNNPMDERPTRLRRTGRVDLCYREKQYVDLVGCPAEVGTNGATNAVA